MRRIKPHGGVTAWINSMPASALLVPAIVFDELQSGVELTRRNDPEKAAEIELWIDVLQATANVVPMDAAIARETARLMIGHSDGDYEDAAIAAAARILNMTVATRNVRDFLKFSVKLFDPFRYRTD